MDTRIERALLSVSDKAGIEVLELLLARSPGNAAAHAKLAEATRAAVAAWDLQTVCADPTEYSNSLTAVYMPAGHDADDFRRMVLQHFNMSLGNGLGKLAGNVFRIGHLGDFNELMLTGTLSGVEMGLALSGVPHRKGGVQAALDILARHADAGATVPGSAATA